MFPFRLLALLGLAWSLSVPAVAAGHPWTVVFNGRPVHRAKTIVRGGVVFIDTVTAIRTWDGLVTFDKNVITASVGDNVGVFTVGSSRVNLNGRMVAMPAAAFRSDGDVYLPLDFFSEKLGSARVRLDQPHAMIQISARNAGA